MNVREEEAILDSALDSTGAEGNRILISSRLMPVFTTVDMD